MPFGFMPCLYIVSPLFSCVAWHTYVFPYRSHVNYFIRVKIMDDRVDIGYFLVSSIMYINLLWWWLTLSLMLESFLHLFSLDIDDWESDRLPAFDIYFFIIFLLDISFSSIYHGFYWVLILLLLLPSRLRHGSVIDIYAEHMRKSNVQIELLPFLTTLASWSRQDVEAL